ncbi:hypothetical protein HELRODRAFT_172692 [Helobdella robusta]|uniref:Uncharacterized protein n=1 Tax=Helobdella robusta TaxID=6412 RepID=T1F5S9_HELRO|nr:hypothetical protein HELRODRAFT_172692 [Helobdella robusta]ESO04331.1 hypothetical protein HELRODRAFT_172692 [Helobdella robusta]
MADRMQVSARDGTSSDGESGMADRMQVSTLDKVDLQLKRYADSFDKIPKELKEECLKNIEAHLFDGYTKPSFIEDVDYAASVVISADHLTPKEKQAVIDMLRERI